MPFCGEGRGSHEAEKWKKVNTSEGRALQRMVILHDQRCLRLHHCQVEDPPFSRSLLYKQLSVASCLPLREREREREGEGGGGENVEEVTNVRAYMYIVSMHCTTSSVCVRVHYMVHV